MKKFTINISTQILAKVIKFEKFHSQIEKLFLCFKRRLQNRILAKPNNKNYGRITILANLKFDIIQNFKISKECFFPSQKLILK